ncbi:hypothetical protein [Fusibacter sp. 3D3]|uniref:hypothetical protein n=1 Tax=Fusibacter sp. 3D3 TaxID=1048380 RepID=UPI0008534EAA|nr:hypothetical protein [Fusibacter sp. 3D3]GAU78656.1 hypothetical protein F3D3_3291 [Fusibacter sp. 3D3]
MDKQGNVFRNFGSLDLSENQIEDVAPLLELLSFYNNQSKDLSFVKTLENLERIHFEGNPIPSGK